MKTLVIYLTVVLWAGVLNAQEVIQLNEARVSFHPINAEVTHSDNSFSYAVKPNYARQFENNPLQFMKENFNIKNYISQVAADNNYDSYQVSFKSRRGQLIADFDRSGTLLKTSQRFEDVILPQELRKQLANEYKGWSVIKTIHKARGNGIENNVDFYKIKLANGKEKKMIKIDAGSRALSEVAIN